ncbi:MAG: ADP-ribosylglycohydrolase family protein [Bryobacteraceae bacterium]
MRAVLITAAIAGVFTLAAPSSPERRIQLTALRDKIEGGWAGQMIGVSFGAPTEFRYKERMIEGDLPKWTPDRVSNALDQDDLYVDMTFAKVLDDKGLDATTEDFGAMFREAKYRLWHANLAARRALKRGVKAELSGTPKYNAHANDIDFQIESDFIGLMCPGLPRASNDLCWRAGRVMNYGDGIYGGMFVSGMYAAAYFENDPRKVVESGLASLPAKSPYALLIADVLAWSKQHPDDWKAVWRLIEQKWNKREPCPEGALKPFNIDAKLNGAYIALGLLYGKGDFTKTLEISTRSGQDSDCNPANACGILGVMLGLKRIPVQWKSGIPALADRKFSYTDFSFRTIVSSTEKRAIAMVRKQGGRVEGETLVVKTQTPVPAKLEVWDDYGSPVERVAASDPRWKWAGSWRQSQNARVAGGRGASAETVFEGSGVIVAGQYLATGGKADVFLDGKLVQTVDAYPDEGATKGGDSLWHAFGLPATRHAVRIVVRGEPYPGSKGTDVSISDLVVFR